MPGIKSDNSHSHYPALGCIMAAANPNSPVPGSTRKIPYLYNPALGCHPTYWYSPPPGSTGKRSHSTNPALGICDRAEIFFLFFFELYSTRGLLGLSGQSI